MPKQKTMQKYPDLALIPPPTPKQNPNSNWIPNLAQPQYNEKELKFDPNPNLNPNPELYLDPQTSTTQRKKNPTLTPTPNLNMNPTCIPNRSQPQTQP